MDCREAQEQILESLAETRPGANTPDLEAHLAGCKACRSFSESQFMLDLQLRAAISAPPLSAAFRASLAKRLRRESVSVWHEILPDVAHVVGCVCATALCLLMLPFAAGPVIVAGLAFTVVTYFVQTVLQGSLEAWEEDRR
jgi:predicted anti-sigma-YlaC factor YlaD